MAELDAIEKRLNEADVPVEDEDHIWTLAERVEWLINERDYQRDAFNASGLF